MNVVVVIRMILFLGGICFLGMDFLAYARQKLTEPIGLLWGLFSLILIGAGLFPFISARTEIENKSICILFLALGLLLVFGIFLLSMSVSRLIMKNRELAMQVSLLNQENERILHELTVLTGKSKTAIS